MASTPSQRALGKLQKLTGNPAILIAASWRPDIATDLDLTAARAFHGMLETVDDAGRLTIVLAARGGRTSFADSVVRALRAAGVAYDLVVPTLVTGVGGLLALGAEKIFVHPMGGVGAFDAGPLAVDATRLSHHLIDDVPALGGIHYHDVDPHLPARLAAGMRERRLARELAQRLVPDDFSRADALSQERLGTELALSAAELADAGFDAETLAEPPLTKVRTAVEDALGILEPPQPPYTESDLGDEVEFEPAVGITAAVIATPRRSTAYVLDTGRPDPDTGRYSGAWEW